MKRTGRAQLMVAQWMTNKDTACTAAVSVVALELEGGEREAWSVSWRLSSLPAEVELSYHWKRLVGLS